MTRKMIIPLFSLAIAAAACQSGNTQQNGSNTTDSTAHNDTSAQAPPPPGIPLQQCYRQIEGKDTALLSLAVDNEHATGKLSYLRYEKDSNKGTFDGVIKNNILRAEYEFMSEGVTSKRKVVFKKEGDKWLEAIPSNLDKEGLPVYTEKDEQLKFNQTPFTNIECRD
ncbi:hypothetical protein KTO58_23300 [Chitinophaga pendula]|uniref:hypothetical protein n=1 Tax=Chitinophaga TaxID=79328 RepID=UPI000BB0C79C|nr:MULTISPECIES: hypothetical protein [Chitinophaga]ASZ10462.1 hypothetical protein CK934_05465 [Chitinophaga sp. MD30]UCJ06567.1 hypothetical protein KTO58_23300 [Chitinophaga pendula]